VKELSNRKKIVISCTDIVEKESVDDTEVYYFNGKKLDKKANGKTEIELAKEKITEIINKFLGRQYENTIVLTGAGSSILKETDINEEIDEGINIPDHSGKTVAELKTEIEKHLNDIPNVFSLDELAKKVKYLPEEGFNIEDLLTKVDMAKDYIDEKEKEKFEETIREIEKKIKDLCDIKLCKYHKHGEFINKLVAKRKSHNRVKIFTTNYDTLFEQALQEEGYIVVDGFSYEFPRKFNSSYFDYDFIIRGENKIIDEPEYVDKVVHLLKIHGSIDWRRNKNGEIIKCQDRDDKSLMIYPRSAKFELSYESPYFDLFSRLQVELRKKSTILIVIGFSFADKHIKSIVKNAMINNPHLNIFIVSPNIETEEYKDFAVRAKKYENVMLFSSTFNQFVDIYRKQVAYSDELFMDVGDMRE
jgi:NAD-dependent SIR2 family protein deacetylase